MRKALVMVMASLSIIGSGIALGNDAVDKPVNIKLGIWIAQQCYDDMNFVRDLWLAQSIPAAIVNTAYDPDSKVVVVALFGAKANAELGREGLKTWWNYLKTDHLTRMERELGIVLTQNDYTLIYHNKDAEGGPKEVIRLEGGKFVLPKGQ